MSFKQHHKPYIALGLTVLVAGASAHAQGISKVEREYSDGSSARFYGQINKGFLNYDDGDESRTYDFIDNNNSGTRFGFTYDRPLNEAWGFGSRIEMNYDPYNSGRANILDDTPGDDPHDFSLENNLRIGELFVRHERWGKFTVGQGSMASDGSSEADLSGVGVIAYSGIADTAGGQLIRRNDGVLSDISVGGAFSNYDGLGRKTRIRYDSRDFNGFGFSTSYGQDALNDDSTDLYDVAATYGNSYGDVEVSAKTAYAWSGSDTEILSGSVSMLHSPTGLNFTVAGGRRDNDDAADGSFGYAKLGWITDFLSVGSSAFGVDWYDGSDVVAEGSDSESVGLAFVQRFDQANTELWMTYREYDYDDNDSDYQKGQAAFAGLRFKW